MSDDVRMPPELSALIMSVLETLRSHQPSDDIVMAHAQASANVLSLPWTKLVERQSRAMFALGVATELYSQAQREQARRERMN